MSKRKRNRDHTPRRKRMRRPARLDAAKHWLRTRTGGHVVRAYARWYAVDLVCAITELRMLGVTVSAEYEAQVRTAIADRQRQAAARAARKQAAAAQPAEWYEVDDSADVDDPGACECDAEVWLGEPDFDEAWLDAVWLDQPWYGVPARVEAWLDQRRDDAWRDDLAASDASGFACGDGGAAMRDGVSQEQASLLDILIDGFEKNEVLRGFHWRSLPMPDEDSAIQTFAALLDEARRWKGPPVRLEPDAPRRVAAWPDLELRQAGRGVMVRVRAPWFSEWWHQRDTWDDDPMDPIHDWIEAERDAT